jgi:hypothetical protein
MPTDISAIAAQFDPPDFGCNFLNSLDIRYSSICLQYSRIAMLAGWRQCRPAQAAPRQQGRARADRFKSQPAVLQRTGVACA